MTFCLPLTVWKQTVKTNCHSNKSVSALMSTNTLCFLTVLSWDACKKCELNGVFTLTAGDFPSTLLLVDSRSSSLTSLSILFVCGYSCSTSSCHILSLSIYIKLNCFVALSTTISNSHSNWVTFGCFVANQCQYKCPLRKQFVPLKLSLKHTSHWQ